jgi:hypothetical protein
MGAAGRQARRRWRPVTVGERRSRGGLPSVKLAVRGAQSSRLAVPAAEPGLDPFAEEPQERALVETGRRAHDERRDGALGHARSGREEAPTGAHCQRAPRQLDATGREAELLEPAEERARGEAGPLRGEQLERERGAADP